MAKENDRDKKGFDGTFPPSTRHSYFAKFFVAFIYYLDTKYNLSCLCLTIYFSLCYSSCNASDLNSGSFRFKSWRGQRLSHSAVYLTTGP
jgi:hypothetical protein